MLWNIFNSIIYQNFTQSLKNMGAQPSKRSTQPLVIYEHTYVWNGRKLSESEYQKILGQKNLSNNAYCEPRSQNYPDFRPNYRQNNHNFKSNSPNSIPSQSNSNQIQTFQTKSYPNAFEPNSHSINSVNPQRKFIQFTEADQKAFSFVPKNDLVLQNKSGPKTDYQSEPKFNGVQDDHCRNKKLVCSPSKNKLNQDIDIQIQREQEKLKAKQASLNQIVRSYQKRIEEAEAFGKKMKDFRKFQEFEAEALANYIQKIKEMNLPEEIQNEQGVSQKLIVGKIASGKSSLINSYFGTNEVVGLGDTTTESKVVYETESKDVQIIDNPGVSENFDIRSVDLIKYIASSSEIYVLYPDSLKSILNLIRVIAAIKPNHLYLLRNQCDRFNQNQVKTLEQQIAEDRKILQNWKIGHLPIFATSSVMPNDFDNQRVRQMMISKPKKAEKMVE